MSSFHSFGLCLLVWRIAVLSSLPICLLFFLSRYLLVVMRCCGSALFRRGDGGSFKESRRLVWQPRLIRRVVACSVLSTLQNLLSGGQYAESRPPTSKHTLMALKLHLCSVSLKWSPDCYSLFCKFLYIFQYI